MPRKLTDYVQMMLTARRDESEAGRKLNEARKLRRKAEDLLRDEMERRQRAGRR